MKPLRILWGSPLPPTRSGVSDYATELLGPLSELARVRVLIPPDHNGLDTMELGCDVELVASDTRPDDSEIPLFHLGNNPYHDWLLQRVSVDRPVVVLHDYVLHHALVEMNVGKGDWQGYESTLVDAYGEQGRAISEARRYGLNGQLDPFLFPATSTVLKSARAVLMHSRWAERQVLDNLPSKPTCVLSLPVADPGEIDRAEVRARLGLPHDRVVVMHLGFLTAEKGFDVILGAVAAALQCGAAVHFVVVGEGDFLPAFQRAVKNLGLDDRVSITGWMASKSFLAAPAAADLGVVLRMPSAGETSAAVLRFIACGTPAAVIGRQQFLEWPEALAPRIGSGASALPDLTRVLVEASDRVTSGTWQKRRSAARSHYIEYHRPENTADAMVRFLCSL